MPFQTSERELMPTTPRQSRGKSGQHRPPRSHPSVWWYSSFSILLWSVVLLSVGCGIYSFRGTSVPSHIKTVAIPPFEDVSGFGEPGLRERFTNELIDRFVQDNTVGVSDRGNADSMLEGTITAVRDEPLVVAEGEQVRKRRVTITLNVVYHDLKLQKKLWQKNFSNWGDYESGAGVLERDPGIAESIDKLTEDILIQTVSGW